MAVYLSPGVYTREIDQSVLPSALGALRPALIGTAKKGPMNTPTLITNAQQFIDTFGEPITTSYLGYAVLQYLEEGTSCWVMRIGVEYKDSWPAGLISDTIDTSGGRSQGWGRIPVFRGIDYGTIYFRQVTTANPVVLHTSTVSDITYTEATAPSSGPSCIATLIFSSTAYTGCADAVYTLTITGLPTYAPLEGSTYTVTDQDGDVIKTGTIHVTGGTGTIPDDSVPIDIGSGLVFQIRVSNGVSLGIGDTFTFSARPDNRTMSVLVEGVAGSYVIAAGTYTTAASLVLAMITATGSGADITPVVLTNSSGTSVPAIRTSAAGRWLQLTGTCAFATEMGVSQYTYDFPRSYMIATNPAPYSMTTSNNEIVMDVISNTSTRTFDFYVATGSHVTVASLVAQFNANNTYSGATYFNAVELTIPGGTTRMVVTTDVTNYMSQLKMQATFVYVKCLRFTDEVGIDYPFTSFYRAFTDTRRVLPEAGHTTPSTPYSCELNPLSAQCAVDTAYFANIVGWVVAKYAGTWSSNYSITLEPYVEGTGDVAGRYKITVYDNYNQPVDVVSDVTFISTDTRYIGNVVNAGSTIGGVNGNSYYQWEMRPAALIDTSDPRYPGALYDKAFTGGANGIPSISTYSSELDNAVIGNPATGSGLYALQNPEAYDFNLLIIPGFTSGAVIGQALQFCENRGDVLFLVDSPYGLKPQQVIEWHNGMLVSDLAAAINSSYGALYWSWLKISDQFNGGTIWVPPSGAVGAVFARTARVAEQWFAPAGVNRGRLLTAIDIEYNPSLGERDNLYGSGNAVNPITKFTRDGIMIWGQRTLQRTSSALDRVNVRMLLIYIKVNLQRVLRAFVFEPNDSITRAQITAVIKPFLADIAARRGLTWYQVICDVTNNTPERIDRNELWITVLLQPTRAAEFLVLNLVVLRTGASVGTSETVATV